MRSFLKLLHKKVSTGATSEVIERMHTEYLLVTMENTLLQLLLSKRVKQYIWSFTKTTQLHMTPTVLELRLMVKWTAGAV